MLNGLRSLLLCGRSFLGRSLRSRLSKLPSLGLSRLKLPSRLGESRLSPRSPLSICDPGVLRLSRFLHFGQVMNGEACCIVSSCRQCEQ